MWSQSLWRGCGRGLGPCGGADRSRGIDRTPFRLRSSSDRERSLVAAPLPVGGNVRAGRAAVGAIAAGAIGGRIQKDLAAGRCLADAEPVDAVLCAEDG